MSNRDHHEIRDAKKSNPDLLTRAALGARLTDLEGLLSTVFPDFVTMRWDLCRPSDIEIAHAAGVAVTFVDGWHPACIDTAIRLGADSVSWHDPAEARNLMERTASRLTPELA